MQRNHWADVGFIESDGMRTHRKDGALLSVRAPTRMKGRLNSQKERKMRMHRMLRFFALSSVLIFTSFTVWAQGPPGHDPDNAPPGHGGTPPGQAKKYGGDDRNMPPSQMKKHFREQDRAGFYNYYQRDTDRWRGRGPKRPSFVPGQHIARGYALQPVPQTVWVNSAPPPPPGCQYGYYGGYVVAYNPTTRIIADVLDLVDAARSR